MTSKPLSKSSFQLGYALSGGTLRSAAHIGVIEVLHAHGIEADIVAGTSGGSLIGAMYANGLSPVWMSGIANRFPGIRLIDWSMPLLQALKILTLVPLHYLHIVKNPAHFIPFGLIKGKKFEQYVRTLLAVTPVRTPIPLVVATTDLLQNQTVIYHSRLSLPEDTNGLAQAGTWIPLDTADDQRLLASVIHASCALPGLFEPVAIGGRTLIDGGIRNYLPIDLLSVLGVKKVIAVDLHKTAIDDPIDMFPEVINRSFDIMLDQITLFRAKAYHPFIITPKIKHVNWTSFDKVLACIDAGREAALQALPAIKDYLKQ
ncbi:patatin-like phospholipase family protein [Fodinisporobacter ferrooxydans]|uniref:Patatin-like phospholipase family protein n=1 Tax=Fodinisporobacter ferrooxydans TaxID=2901836 RepID=A0ABY4CH89_9BACL|nr:patatin-like phospholipase family protein [Alicyclobacillaceae bacterium MYW30-H2]